MSNQPQPAIPPPLAAELANLNRRLRVMEEHISTLRSHMELIDASLNEKHKSNIDDIREMQANIREIKVEVLENKQFSERITNKLSDFANKESIKVLERYINFWDPLHYVTKQEVEDLIKTRKR